MVVLLIKKLIKKIKAFFNAFALRKAKTLWSFDLLSAIGLLVHAKVSSGARYLTFNLSTFWFNVLCVSSEDSGDTAIGRHHRFR